MSDTGFSDDTMLSAQHEPVDRNSPMPAWVQVERDIRRMVDGGELVPGSQLPRETDLAGEYHVSRITVRQALAHLSAEGYVERRQGSGTFVSERTAPIQHDLSLRGSWRDLIRAEGHTTASEVLQIKLVEQIPGAISSEITASEADAPMTRLRRRHIVDGSPLGLTESWIPLTVAADLAVVELRDASLSATLEERYDLRPATITNTIRTVMATATEARLLDTYNDVPLFIVYAVGRLADGTLLEASRTAWLGSRVRFSTVQRPD